MYFLFRSRMPQITIPPSVFKKAQIDSLSDLKSPLPDKSFNSTLDCFTSLNSSRTMDSLIRANSSTIKSDFKKLFISKFYLKMAFSKISLKKLTN